MTQDEIIDLARQAGFTVSRTEPLFFEMLQAFKKLVALPYEKKIADLENIICQRHWDVLQKREACANLCEDTNQEYESYTGRPFALNYTCATAIRARGEA